MWTKGSKRMKIKIIGHAIAAAANHNEDMRKWQTKIDKIMKTLTETYSEIHWMFFTLLETTTSERHCCRKLIAELARDFSYIGVMVMFYVLACLFDRQFYQ